MRLLWLFAIGLALRAESDVADVLERFRPVFRIAAADCDVAPAEFDPRSATPKALARNGTIYVSSFERKPGWMEVHYYHLWAQDCGKGGHRLDAEHVSGLLQRVDGEWKAMYWYAGAHEDTPCDGSMAGRADYLDAETRGPYVWVSQGKHASFLSDSSCKVGCGGDKCDRTKELAKSPLVLLDAEAPWVQSTLWQLRLKFATDFDDALLQVLENRDLRKLVAAKPHIIPSRRVLGAGNRGIEETGGALETGGRHTDGSLELATKKTGEALGTATRKVKRFLGMK